MFEASWQVYPDRGFLMKPDPLRHLSEAEHDLPEYFVDQIEGIAAELPTLLASRRLRATLEDLPVYDLAEVSADYRVAERLALLYGFFASAYVHMPGDMPVSHLPAGVAASFTQISRMVGRPPILSYGAMALGNWRRVDPEGALDLDNLAALNTFLGLADESWFLMVHVAIEARAADILRAIRESARAVAEDDGQAMLDILRQINWGIIALIKTFHRMPEGCDPDVYYQQVRPYLFGFTNLIFDGVKEFEGKPQTLRGGSGAQSSIVPALIKALGIQHEASELTHHLTVMQTYMPPEHRRFIAEIDPHLIRDYVVHKPPLADAYNACLRQLMTFRRAHLYYAKTYIFEKSTSAVGTGGTQFMDFLSKLVEETEAHLI